VTTVQALSIEREIRIEARPETVFPFLVDADKMTRWMGTVATLDARPGGLVSILVAGQHQATGEYLEIDPPHRVLFTFGWEDPGAAIPPGGSLIEIVLAPDGDATVLRFKHSNVPENTVADHTVGWTHYLGRLQTVASGGNAGPDPWAAGNTATQE
jgi:uncharacterized protein YndB with AHSA1/START domain